MKSPRGPGRPPEVDRRNRVQQITRAAIKQFAAHGYAATSFGSVARHAGLTPSALYHYYDDKRALYIHAVRFARREVWETICEAFHHRETLVEDFAELGRVILAMNNDSFAQATRLLATVQATATHHDELADLRAERWLVRADVVGAIGRRAFERGELPTFASSEQAARAIEVIFSGWATEVYASFDHRHEVMAASLALVGMISAQPIRASQFAKPQHLTGGNR